MTEKICIFEAFGIETNSKKSVCFRGQNHLIYLIGSNLITLDLKSKKSRITQIKTHGKVEYLNVTNDMENLVLIDMEKRDTYITLLDLKTINYKLIRSIKLENELVTSVSFANNSQFLACQTSKNSITLFSLPRLNKLSTIETSQDVKEISFFGPGCKRILAIGSKFAKIYLYTNKSGLKLTYSLNCNLDLETHSWLNNGCLSRDKFGNFFIIDPKFNLIKPIAIENHNITLDINPVFEQKISSIVCGENCFFLVSKDSDQVLFYEGSKSNVHSYSEKAKIRLSNTQDEKIIAIYLDPTQKHLFALTTFKVLYSVDLTLIAENQTSDLIFEPIKSNESRHYASITGLSCCSSRPKLVASCSIDRFLNLWNVETSEFEAKHRFDDEVLSINMHPSGLFLLVSTSTSINLMGVYLDAPKVRVLASLRARQCTICEFSNCDDRFAFAHGTVIRVFSMIRFEQVGAIRAHELGRIKQLKFSRNDGLLISCSIAGIIRIWNLHTLSVVSELMTRGVSFTGMSIHPSDDHLFLISTEKFIGQYELPMRDPDRLRMSKAPKLIRKLDINPNENATTIEISKRGDLLCIGTNKGSIRLYTLPSGAHREFRAHFTYITRLCLMPRSDYLISSCEDGSLIVYSLDFCMRHFFDSPEEAFLVDKNERIDRLKSIKQSTEKLAESQQIKEFKLRKQRLKLKISLRAISNRYSSQLSRLKSQLESIISHYKENEVNFSNRLNDMLNSHFNDCEKMKSFYDERISNERKINSEFELKLNKFESDKFEIICKNKNRLDNHLEILLNEEKTKHAEQLESIDAKLLEILKFEEGLDEEFDFEILTLISDLKQTCLPLFNEISDRKQQIRLMRSELESLKISFKDYKERNKEKQNALSELRERCKKASIAENELKSSFKPEERLNELLKLDDQIKSLDIENEAIKLENQALEEKKRDLEKRYERTLVERVYYEKELFGIGKEIKRKRMEKDRAKCDLFSYRSRINANEKIRKERRQFKD